MSRQALLRALARGAGGAGREAAIAGGAGGVVSGLTYGARRGSGDSNEEALSKAGAAGLIAALATATGRSMRSPGARATDAFEASQRKEARRVAANRERDIRKGATPFGNEFDVASRMTGGRSKTDIYVAASKRHNSRWLYAKALRKKPELRAEMEKELKSIERKLSDARTTDAAERKRLHERRKGLRSILWAADNP